MHDFQGVLHVGAGAHFEMRDNAPVRIFGASESSGVISGRGNILVASTIPFANSGTIDPDANGGITITQGTLDRFPIKLDSLFGAGHLKLDTPFSELEINASQLADSFSGIVSMAPGALLTMNLEESWRADFFSSINVGGLSNPAAASQIAGSDVELDGGINVGGAQGHLRVLANAAVGIHADAHVGVGDWLEFDGVTTLNGGQFGLSADAQLDFDGETIVRGGQFTTFSNLSNDGSVNFNGETEWNGMVTINGVARQVGNAGVTGPTTINAGVFDMDGNGGSTWNVNSVAMINAAHIDSSISDTFDGTIDVGSGFLPRLTINLDDSHAQWTMAGEMSLSGVPGASFFTNRLAGSHMRLNGDLNLNRLAGIAADATFANGSTLNFAHATTALRMNGTTRVEAGAVFTGPGTLRNGPTGQMTLASGVSLGQVGLVNENLLAVGDSAGIATVDRFENLADGVWNVELGGYLAGAEFDLLVVGGGAALLDGMIEVELIDSGGGLFLPMIGDEFTILTALSGVTGEFIHDPVSMAAGLTFHWSVLYNPNDVTLRLTDVTVPEPSAWGLAMLGTLAWMSRRARAAGRVPCGAS